MGADGGHSTTPNGHTPFVGKLILGKQDGQPPAVVYFNATETDWQVQALTQGTSDQRIRLRRDGGRIGFAGGGRVSGDRFRGFRLATGAVCRFRADWCSCHQPPSHQKQIAEGEQREELGAVLGQALGRGSSQGRTGA